MSVNGRVFLRPKNPPPIPIIRAAAHRTSLDSAARSAHAAADLRTQSPIARGSSPCQGREGGAFTIEASSSTLADTPDAASNLRACAHFSAYAPTLSRLCDSGVESSSMKCPSKRSPNGNKYLSKRSPNGPFPYAFRAQSQLGFLIFSGRPTPRQPAAHAQRRPPKPRAKTLRRAPERASDHAAPAKRNHPTHGRPATKPTTGRRGSGHSGAAHRAGPRGHGGSTLVRREWPKPWARRPQGRR